MKKILLMLVIISSLFFGGCEVINPDPFNPGDDTTEIPLGRHAVRITAPEGLTVPLAGTTYLDDGDDLVISIKDLGGYERAVFLDGEEQLLTGDSLKLENVLEDHNVKILFTMTDQLRLLVNKKWLLTEWTAKGQKFPDYFWKADFSGGDSVFIIVSVFYPYTYTPSTSSKLEDVHLKGLYFDNQGNRIGNFEYELINDSIIYPRSEDNNTKILKLNEDTLITKGFMGMGNEYDGDIDQLISIRTYKPIK